MKRPSPLTLAISWTLFILALCVVPGNDLPEVQIVGIDKIVHVVMFALFGILWLRTTPDPSARKAIQVIYAGIIYGIAIEVIQQLLNMGRVFDPYDAIADALGVIISVSIMMYLRVREPERT